MNKRPELDQYQVTIRVAIIGLLAGIATIGTYTYLYFSQGIPQALIAAGTVFVAALMMPVVMLLARRAHFRGAGIILLLAVMLAYLGQELAWEGLLIYHVLAGLFLITLAGNILHRDRPLIWIAGILLYEALIVIISRYPPFERYDASQSAFHNNFAMALDLLLGAGALLQFFSILQKRSLRLRLMAVNLLLVLLPLVAVSIVVNYLGNSSSQRQVMNQLNSVATLKEAELNTWIQSMKTSLPLILPQPEEVPLWAEVLDPQASANPAANYESALAELQARFDEAQRNTTVFEEIFILDPEGRVALSTDRTQTGAARKSREYFRNGLLSTSLTPPTLEPATGKTSLILSMPIHNLDGQVIGVLVGRANMATLSEVMMQRAGLGETGETYLLRDSHTLLTDVQLAGYEPGISYLHSYGINRAIEDGISGEGLYSNYQGVPVLGVYRWLPDLQMALIAEQNQAEALAPATTTLLTNIVVTVLALLISVSASLFATQRITRPLAGLAQTAEQIAGGDLMLNVKVDRDDEIGSLAKALNSMTTQLRGLIGRLEERVIDRTRELEKRTAQIQVSAEVARDTATMRDVNELLNRAADLIRDRFGFYHAGIFIADEAHEWAILRAATGEAGEKMLAAGHKLAIGQVGLVGHAVATGQPRIALDVGADSVHFKNPLLPRTRSEMALPLKAGDRVIGALDVQSTEPTAFDDEDVRVLQILADQLAVAIENASLFQEMRGTVEQLEATQKEYTQQAWETFAQRTGQVLGFRYGGLTVEQVTERHPEAIQALEQAGTVHTLLRNDAIDGETATGSALAVPIRMRDQVIGVLDLHFSQPNVPQELQSACEEIASRLSLALESSRLLEETRLRSEQLRLLQEITSAASSHVHLNTLLEDVGQRLNERFQLTHSAALLFDPEKNAAQFVSDVAAANQPAGFNLNEAVLLVAETPALQELIQHPQALFVENARSNPSLASLHEPLARRETESLVLIPLVSRGAAIGALSLELDNPTRKFNEEDLRLFDQIGLQVSVALDVARLFEQTEKRAERERQISDITAKVRASTNLDTILQTSIQELAQALNLTKSTILLKGSAGGNGNE